MYLEHFGLNEPPFRITPSTSFFYSGANRGEILDALIYSLKEVEGIVKVCGEVGSGKTMLCRMLIERMPENIETIYLANPSLTREEMLYAIADGLGLKVDGERVGIIMHSIQIKLEERADEGKRVVVLVDEAHAMPPETLEELRLLYNLQVGDFKLLQIVLFGQPELNAKLNQPDMRQLKDRIVHHFDLQPVSRALLGDYLMFRMQAAGYRGPEIFSPAALKLIADASNGLIRRINILADKSLLAAFVEDTHRIEPRHVLAAMRDSDISPPHKLRDKQVWAGAALAALALLTIGTWWMLRTPETGVAPARQDEIQQAAADTSAAMQENQASVSTLETPATREAIPAPARVAAKASLFDRRLAAGKQLYESKRAAASIQLFYNDDVRPARIESFLQRADKLGVLDKIYLLPNKFGEKDGIRVLFGSYPSADAAGKAITAELPLRYQQAFTASVYQF